MRNNLSFKSPLWAAAMMLFFLIFGSALQAEALTLDVMGCDTDNNCTTPVTGFRWLIEEDNTTQSPPGVRVNNSVSITINNSYAPVIATGHEAGSSANITIPKKFKSKGLFVSVLPDGVSPTSDYTSSGAQVVAGQTSVTVNVHKLPIPTGQVSVLVFKDHNPINNIFDVGEELLGGWTVLIFDQGGQMSKDIFGNPLGTLYAGYDPDSPIPGSGLLTTCTQTEVDAYNAQPDKSLVKRCTQVGELFIKNLAAGKYGVRAVPPGGENPLDWVQTATIEGTPGIDAWPKPNEPNTFIEGFGTGFYHAFIGFVKPSELPWASGGPGGATITGSNMYNHFGRPPANQGFFVGPPVGECWIGLNDLATAQGLMAVPCDDASNFVLNGVPAGTYQLVTWDKPLDALFGSNNLSITDADVSTGTKNLGNVLSFRWFGTYEGSVFYDTNQNGFRDAGEVGVPNTTLNLRFRDGSMYQTTFTDITGEYGFSEVFPFFKWLIAEVDYINYKPTGMTTAVDFGGAIPTPDPVNDWLIPSFGKLNPQPQAKINPNTGNNLSRTETGPVLLEAMHLFLNQTNVVDWGKVNYANGENGGITGIVFYSTTRAENDPALAAGETWEPGIPRVQVNLYKDFNNDGIIDDLNGNGRVDLAGVSGKGDAFNVTLTDSWDDNKPTGCVQTLPPIPGVKPCFDNYGTWNQVRPGVFDGGYAFGFPAGKPDLPPGIYIVEAVPPPGYLIQKEEDKNVDFGEGYTPSPLALPPPCVGTAANKMPAHIVPDFLVLFPDQQIPAYRAGETTPLCTMKQVLLEDKRNAAADFFMFTEVPKAARVVGFVNNDLSAEFRAASPVFGEKSSPSWLPVSFQDWKGNEVARVYSDEFGSYNALLPSTFTINPPIPTGVSPNLVTAVLNHPFLPDGSIDPFYDPTYSVTPWTLDYWPGKTTYLDTPLVPVAAFAGFPQNGPDVEPADGTPQISSVDNTDGAIFGPVICAADQSITITSMGKTEVPNPDFDPSISGSKAKVTRDYGFGKTPGKVVINGIEFTTFTSWTDSEITLPVTGAATGQLMVTRGDNDKTTEIGITFHDRSADACATVLYVAPADTGTPVQDAIDAAVDGDLIIIEPGTYRENIFLYKNIALQGSGNGSTVIFANPTPAERLQAWHAKALALIGNDDPDDPFIANEAPGIMVLGTTLSGTTDPSLIDGLKVFGGLSGGGIYVYTDTDGLKISNNRVQNNQGNFGGGITIGEPNINHPNPNLVIVNNYVLKNGGVDAGGGVVIWAGADNYIISDNVIGGNFSRFYGGGISHAGLSNNGLITRNQVIFNEVAFGGVLYGDGGGIFVGSNVIPGLIPGVPPTPETPGSGNVTIDRNLIQGNLAGVGRGGGIMALYFNGPDIDGATPGYQSYTLTITDNMIVNNAAGWNGGGIGLQDVTDARIINNTIANNDNTSTAANAFPAGSVDTIPHGAGIVSNMHSATLQGDSGQLFANPLLQNNIIWNNRAFFTTNGGSGGLIAASEHPSGLYGDVWDLEVEGMPSATYLSPTNALLTSLTYPDGSDYTGNGNLSTDTPRFVLDYVNELFTAAVLDEGGNFITVRFKPLTRSSGDYHLRFDSPAVDAGAATPAAADYDGEARPNGAAFDIGADEFYAPSALDKSLALIAPNGGEILQGDTQYTIYWGVDTTKQGASSFNHYLLQYSLDNGVTWVNIADNRSVTTFGDVGLGVYDWAVPSPKKNQRKVLVRVVAHNAAHTKLASDNSDAPVTIQVIRLISPNGNEMLTSGSSFRIQWEADTAKTVQKVKLEFKRTTAADWTPIKVVKAVDPGFADGFYDWTVPNVGKVTYNYKVRITLLNKGNGVIGLDVSDNVFYIQPNLFP